RAVREAAELNIPDAEALVATAPRTVRSCRTREEADAACATFAAPDLVEVLPSFGVSGVDWATVAFGLRYSVSVCPAPSMPPSPELVAAVAELLGVAPAEARAQLDAGPVQVLEGAMFADAQRVWLRLRWLGVTTLAPEGQPGVESAAGVFDVVLLGYALEE